jgi:hypothetical protein
MKNFSIEIRWAIRFTLLTLVWGIGEKLYGLHDVHIDQYLFISILFGLPAVLFYYLAIREKKKYFFNGNMTWKQGFVSSIILSFLIAILSPFAHYVIYKSISPDFFENMIAYKTAHSSMSREALQSIFNMKTIVVNSFIDSLSYGIITGALVSLLLRNKPSN